MVSVQLIKKHKTARLLPNGLAITTTASRKVLQRRGLPSCWAAGELSIALCWQPARANAEFCFCFCISLCFCPKQTLSETRLSSANLCQVPINP